MRCQGGARDDRCPHPIPLYGGIATMMTTAKGVGDSRSPTK